MNTEADLRALYRELEQAAPTRVDLTIPTPVASRQRPAWPGIVAACALVLALILVPTLLLNRGGAKPADQPRPSAVAPSPTPSTAVPTPGSAPTTMNLLQAAVGWGAEYGVPRPTSAQVAPLTRAQALTVATYTPALRRGSGDTVYVMVEFGAFSCGKCIATLRSGRRLVTAFDPVSNGILGVAMDSSNADLSGFAGMVQLDISKYVTGPTPTRPVLPPHPPVTRLTSTLSYPGQNLLLTPPPADTVPQISAQQAWRNDFGIFGNGLADLPAAAVATMQLVLYTDTGYGGPDAQKYDSYQRLAWMIRITHAGPISPIPGRSPTTEDSVTQLRFIDATTGQVREAAQSTDLDTPSPAPPVKMPEVVGLTEAEAMTKLKALDFVVDVRSVKANNPAGTVLDQSVNADADVARGSLVLITVSTGP